MSLASKKMYIYNLPHRERRDLCRILDQNKKWEELAGTYMKYDVLTIQVCTIQIIHLYYDRAIVFNFQELRNEFSRGNSPTEELLTMWGHHNHSVLELFVLLSRMHHYQAMTIIKQFVDKEYHRLIDEGEQNPDVLMQQLVLNDNKDNMDKEQNVPKENFNKSEKILNVLRKELGVTSENKAHNNLQPEQFLISRDDNNGTEHVSPHQQLLKPKSPLVLHL